MNVRAVADLSPDERAAFFERDAGVEGAREAAREILSRVRTEGDVALRSYASEFDDVEIGTIEITDEAERAYEAIDADLREAIEAAADNVRAFHERSAPEDWRDSFDGRELGRRFRPLSRVGVYAPGGTATYPSSVLMGVIPAKVAGVDHVAVATPPAEDLPPATLAAAHVAGADAVYQAAARSGRGARLRDGDGVGRREDRRAGQQVGHGGEGGGPRRRRDRLSGRPSELLVVCDGRPTPTSSRPTCSHRPSTTRTPPSSVSPTTREPPRRSSRRAANRPRLAIAGTSSTPPSKTTRRACCAPGRCPRPSSSPRSTPPNTSRSSPTTTRECWTGSTPPEASSSARPRPSPPAITPPARTTSFRRAGPRRSSAALVEHFLRSTTVQKLDREALADLRGTVTTLARAEGLEAHAESVDKRFL